MYSNYSSLSTPCFVINKAELKHSLETLKASLQRSWGNYIIGYSYKTNALPWVVSFMNENGCFAEVVSDDEYNLAKSINANGVIYNGIAKSKETFIEALEKNQIINIDSEYEIEWLSDLDNSNKEYSVGIRVNFDLESKCPGQTQCGEDGERFGFCYENGELKRAIDKITSKGIKVVGLHLHKSSKTRMPDIYKAIAETAVEIAQKYELELSYVDIGGGFFGGLANKPQFSDYFEMVSNILKKQFDPSYTSLIVEPGMALIGANVDYISDVLDVKKTTRNTFVVTNGSRIHIDPLMTKKNYFYQVIRSDDLERQIINKQIVSGFTCMEHDRIFEAKEELSILPGDRIIYHKVGAYTMCLSPLFIKWFPNVYVFENNRLTMVRNKWEAEDYKSRSI